jgi:hypothetical protein
MERFCAGRTMAAGEMAFIRAIANLLALPTASAPHRH